jgi:hypothetical protein
MSKVPAKQVTLVRQMQATATDHELRFADEGFKALFQHPPVITQIDGYIGALSAVLTITEGGHLSEPALKAIALMLGRGMDEAVALVAKYKEEQANALHVPGRSCDEAGTAGDAVRPDPG